MSKIEVKKNTTHIYELIEECANFGVSKAVLCPGSRCAPLLIGFAQHPAIETISITDERSAGFIALGLSQQLKTPVVLVCTSGTAVLNFAPAICEAYYQNVPLIVLTADRPPHLIDQWDGQTICQQNIYQNYILGSFVFVKENIKVAKDALQLAISGGPVHLNIPISEPFYPNKQLVNFATNNSFIVKKVEAKPLKETLVQELQDELNGAKNILILGGQYELSDDLIKLLNQIKIPIVADIISNLHAVKGVISKADIVFNTNQPDLQPDMLISFGRSVISKNLKLYLRKFKPKSHWHIGLGMIGDPFDSLTKTVVTTPEYFFNQWLKHGISYKNQDRYKTVFETLYKKVVKKLNNNLAGFNNISVVARIIANLPVNSVLHLANSMPVRIANLIGVNKRIEVWSNRGTSGIDGTLSTAVGHALANPNKSHTLIVGDIGFFYDRNALWLNCEFPKNLIIIILNDGGGGIFDIIPGPANIKQMQPLFTTPHKRNAKLTAMEFNLQYRAVYSIKELEQTLTGFNAGIIEVFTQMNINTKVYKSIFVD